MYGKVIKSMGLGMVVGALVSVTVVPNLKYSTRRKISKFGKGVTGGVEEFCLNAIDKI